MKRGFDILGAALALLILLPLLLSIAVLVRLKLGQPVLFRQLRPGLRGQPFRLVKFRTMRDLNDETGNPLPDEKRLTEFGKWLRRTSLDELPELWNVLKGEMGLVGPRPLLMDYLPLYSAEQTRRHEVRPGITGWAQVMGRNALSWEEKFALDLWYVEHQSFWLDMRILIMTVARVCSGAGVSKEGFATTEKFRGSAGQEGSSSGQFKRAGERE